MLAVNRNHHVRPLGDFRICGRTTPGEQHGGGVGGEKCAKRDHRRQRNDAATPCESCALIRAMKLRTVDCAEIDDIGMAYTVALQRL
jgi:hypothetical protein